MKLSIYIDTENKKEVETLGKIYKALSDKATKSDIDAYIAKKVNEILGVKK